tara:strand:- start:12 stop:425 length:414 start_codon:yes stop_codon:yes gene_type:complete
MPKIILFFLILSIDCVSNLYIRLRNNFKQRIKKMTQKRYNGWTNYETWNCKLWLDNEQSIYEMIQDKVDDYFIKSNQSSDKVISSLTSFLKSYVESSSPELNPSMYSDMLNASLREINFYEISKSYIDDYTWNGEVA